MSRITYIPNRVIDTDGIADGAALYVYQTGTSTPISLFSDAALTVPVSNPYVVISGAAVPALYHNYDGNIRLRILSNSGAEEDYDPYDEVIYRDTLDEELAALAVFRPEDYAAVGNGIADDYAAFSDLITAVNAAGGGIIRLARGATYYIGQYVTAANGITDLTFNGCNGLIIEGNGAKLDFKGNFDRDVATTRGLAFNLTDCSNGVIQNLEVDGNVDQMTNSSGSAEAITHGLALRSSTDILVENCYFHHMATDGIWLQLSTTNGINYRACRRIILRNVRSLYNARQGLSIIQARGVVCENCDFSYTGRSVGTYGIHSPAGGVDIEPTRTTSTAAPNTMDIDTGDIEFRNCVMEENAGAQFLCGGGVRYDDVRLYGGRIRVGDGSTSGSDCAVVGCPGFVMRDCDVDIGQNVKIFYVWPNAANVAGDILIAGNRFAGKGSLLRSNGAPTGNLIIDNNVFDATGAAPLTGTNIIELASGTGIRFRHNNIFVAKEIYTDGGSGDRHIILSFTNVVESVGNTFTTDLLAASGSSGTAHYANGYGAATVVRNDKYTGTAVGALDTFRPIFNEVVFNTTYFYNRNHPGSNVPGKIVRGDEATTFNPTLYPAVLYYNTPLTADREVTLSTTAGYIFTGAKCRVVRTAAATGAFNLNVGTGPLKALAAGQWCEVEYDGSVWVLTANGSL